MAAKRIGEAALVGLRGRLGARAASELSRRTRLDEGTLRTAIGLYLFVSRTRRMVEMLRRIRRGPL